MLSDDLQAFFSNEARKHIAVQAAITFPCPDSLESFQLQQVAQSIAYSASQSLDVKFWKTIFEYVASYNKQIENLSKSKLRVNLPPISNEIAKYPELISYLVNSDLVQQQQILESLNSRPESAETLRLINISNEQIKNLRYILNFLANHESVYHTLDTYVKNYAEQKQLFKKLRIPPIDSFIDFMVKGKHEEAKPIEVNARKHKAEEAEFAKPTKKTTTQKAAAGTPDIVPALTPSPFYPSTNPPLTAASPVFAFSPYNFDSLMSPSPALTSANSVQVSAANENPITIESSDEEDQIVEAEQKDTRREDFKTIIEFFNRQLLEQTNLFIKNPTYELTSRLKTLVEEILKRLVLIADNKASYFTLPYDLIFEYLSLHKSVENLGIPHISFGEIPIPLPNATDLNYIFENFFTEDNLQAILILFLRAEYQMQLNLATSLEQNTNPFAITICATCDIQLDFIDKFIETANTNPSFDSSAFFDEYLKYLDSQNKLLIEIGLSPTNSLMLQLKAKIQEKYPYLLGKQVAPAQEEVPVAAAALDENQKIKKTIETCISYLQGQIDSKPLNEILVKVIKDIIENLKEIAYRIDFKISFPNAFIRNFSNLIFIFKGFEKRYPVLVGAVQSLLGEITTEICKPLVNKFDLQKNLKNLTDAESVLQKLNEMKKLSTANDKRLQNIIEVVQELKDVTEKGIPVNTSSRANIRRIIYESFPLLIKKLPEDFASYRDDLQKIYEEISAICKQYKIEPTKSGLKLNLFKEGKKPPGSLEDLGDLESDFDFDPPSP